MVEHTSSNLPAVGRARGGRRRLGFTAIEITAVATIIAILALILIPIVRKRVEESKIVAAKDDMQGIEKAQEIAFGYLGHYVRLFDLDRPEPDHTLAVGDTRRVKETLKLPPAFWDRQVYDSEINFLYDNWRGPFLAAHNTASVYNLLNSSGILFSVDGAQGGPIPLFSRGTLNDDKDWVADSGGLTRRQYPVDPWGNPYLFFGPGKGNNYFQSGQNAAGESEYGTAVIYSMGPDGIPGPDPYQPYTSTGPAVADYYRGVGLLGGGKLGTGDDLRREF